MALQTLLVERKEEEGEVVVLRPNTRLNVDIAKPPTFNWNATKVSEFIMACRLYIRMRMRDVLVKKQV